MRQSDSMTSKNRLTINLSDEEAGALAELLVVLEGRLGGLIG